MLSGNFLMEKCQLEHYLQFSIKCFCETILNFKVFVKSIIDPDNNFWSSSSINGLIVGKEIGLGFKYFEKKYLFVKDLKKSVALWYKMLTIPLEILVF